MNGYARLDHDEETGTFDSMSPFSDAGGGGGPTSAMREGESPFQPTEEAFAEPPAATWEEFEAAGEGVRAEYGGAEEELDPGEALVDERSSRRGAPAAGSRRQSPRVTELLELWELANAVNERVRRLVLRALGPSALTRPGAGRRGSALPPLREEELDEGAPGEFQSEFEGADAAVIDGLIGKGLSDNDVTNDVFYRRNPALRGQALRGGTKAARQWSAIREREVRPAAKALLDERVVDPVKLAIFFSQYEGDSRVPAGATEEFLTRSPLLSMGRSLRDRVVANWRAGGRPLTSERLYALALDVAGQAAFALLLCHNITKAFSRGGAAITWDRVESAPDTYSDGKKTWTPEVIHPGGKIKKTPSTKYKRALPSIFYVLFTDREFGTDDPGDWYHYFVAASMAAFGATERLGPGSRRAREFEEGERGSRDAVTDAVYPMLVSDRLLDLERQMTRADLAGVPGYRGWVLANVLSFLEGGHYGQSQDEVGRESRDHVRGALAGLLTRRVKPGRDWLWHVPIAGSLSKEDLLTGFTLRQKTAERIDAAGRRVGP